MKVKILQGSRILLLILANAPLVSREMLSWIFITSWKMLSNNLKEKKRLLFIEQTCLCWTNMYNMSILMFEMILVLKVTFKTGQWISNAEKLENTIIEGSLRTSFTFSVVLCQLKCHNWWKYPHWLLQGNKWQLFQNQATSLAADGFWLEWTLCYTCYNFGG